MKTKLYLLKLLASILLITYSCSQEHEMEIGSNNESITNIELVSENQSLSTCQITPFIEDENGNSITQVKTGTPFYVWLNPTLCGGISLSTVNIYLEKVTSSGYDSYLTIDTNINPPVLPDNRYQITLSNNVESGKYIIKIVNQPDIPNGIFGGEVFYSNIFTVFNITTSIVPNGDFDSKASWTLSSGGNIANSKLITPDMCSVNTSCSSLFTATSSYFTIASGSKYLILSNGLHGGKFQLINSSNQSVFSYTNNAGYGSSDQMKSFDLPSTGNYKIKLTYYGDNFGDSQEEAQGTILDYVILN